VGWSVTVAARGLWILLPLLACLLALPGQAEAQVGEPPNIVLVLTDDQRWDTLGVMPTVQNELVAQGVSFSNAFVTNPVCCPSRSTILTGRYSHGTGVYSNSGPNGGFKAFDDRSTLATWLDSDGYQTALIGKYLVGYSGSYIPRGWDRWVAFSGRTAYFDYTLNEDRNLVTYGDQPSDYSTDVLAARAVQFIGAAEEGRPLFLHFAPFAPHANSWVTAPAPRHEGRFAGIAPWRPPNYDEADIADKPYWIRRLPRLTPERRARTDFFRRGQLESLLAVDDAVDDVIGALEASGRLENTIIIFTSDNGHAWGEHRWVQKLAPYEESIRVPLVIRYDPLTSSSARTDPRFALNVDLAPTVARLAGVAAPGAQGRSLLPLLAGQAVAWRRDFLLEHGYTWGIPTYCGVRSARYTYAQYRPGVEELYDLASDPYQLTNRARDPSLRPTIVAFRSRLRALCNPPPPGFTPRSPCLVLGNNRPNVLRGTRYYDYVCAYSGADRVTAGAGTDRVVAGHGNDVVYGQAGEDTIYGQWGNDVLLDRSDAETDRIYGGAGRDTIWADDGRLDVVACGEEADVANVDRRDRVYACETVRRR
jgi:N-acetylglucosamine-6-sulfatase